MLAVVRCPKDNQRLFDFTIEERDSGSIDAESKDFKEIEIKCPRCRGIVGIELGQDDFRVTMISPGNPGKK